VTPLSFLALSISVLLINHRALVGICLDSNENRGTTEHLANLDQKESDLENVMSFLFRAYGTLNCILYTSSNLVGLSSEFKLWRSETFDDYLLLQLTL